jgi:hypothetical protein
MNGKCITTRNNIYYSGADICFREMYRIGMGRFNEESDREKRTLLFRFSKDEFFIERPLFLRTPSGCPFQFLLLANMQLQAGKSKTPSITSSAVTKVPARLCVT